MSHVNRLDWRRWAYARREALDRDGWRCTKCGKAGVLEVDHVKPLDQGGESYKLENLATLCRECHFNKTWAERSTPEQVKWRRYQYRIDREAVAR